MLDDSHGVVLFDAHNDAPRIDLTVPYAAGEPPVLTVQDDGNKLAFALDKGALARFSAVVALFLSRGQRRLTERFLLEAAEKSLTVSYLNEGDPYKEFVRFEAKCAATCPGGVAVDIALDGLNNIKRHLRSVPAA